MQSSRRFRKGGSGNGPWPLAQLRTASRNAACTAVSSVLRNRDRSFLVRGDGPGVLAPSSRRCLATSRPTSALPIFACVHCLPVGETTRAPFLRQRDASGISEVTHTSTAGMCSTIQSSAASAASPTRTMRTFEVPGGLIGREPLETTGAPRRGRSPPAPGTHHHRRRCPSTLDPLSTELQTRVTRTRSDAMVEHLE